MFRLGSAVLEVSQARQPCWRLNVCFGDPGMARQVQESRRTDWYYRVLELGHARAGDALECVERPHPQWPFSRILDLFYRDPLNTAELEALLGLSALAESWRARVEELEGTLAHAERARLGRRDIRMRLVSAAVPASEGLAAIFGR